MALRFDPASILAPGGVMSGLDDLGSAVMNAMNRRAERKYASEAAAAKAAAEESQFARGLGSREKIAAEGNTAAMERVKAENAGAFGRTALTQGQQFASKLIGEGSDILQTGMRVVGGWGRKSGSVDGKNELAAVKELNDTLADAERIAVAKYKDYVPTLQEMYTTTGAAAVQQKKAAIEQARKQAVADYMARAGYAASPDGKYTPQRATQIPVTPGLKVAGAMGTPPAPAGAPATDPAKAEAWSRAQKNGWTLEQFEARWAAKQQGK